MKCVRCRETFGAGRRCQECGVGRDRIVRKMKRRRPLGGKRGRNSGTVGTSKVKK